MGEGLINYCPTLHCGSNCFANDNWHPGIKNSPEAIASGL
jgi:hypothetical protein